MVDKTIGNLGGQDYATPALWFASLVSGLSADQRGLFQNCEVVVTAAQSLTGITTNGFTITLTTGTGNSFVDNANKLTNALRYNASNGAGIRKTSGSDAILDIQNDNFTISKLQLKNEAAYCIPLYFAGSTYNTRIVDQCIVQSSAATVGTTPLLDMNSNTGNANIVRNSVFLATNTTTSYSGIRSNHANSLFVNNTIITTGTGGSTTGFITVYESPILKNNVVIGFTTDYSGTCGASSTNNATDKATFGGTNYGGSGQVSCVGATEFQSVTNGSEDLRVKSTSAKLKNNGTSTGTPSTDIVGQTRSGTPTIGAWEVVAGGSDTGISPARVDLALSQSAPTRAVNTYMFPDADVTDGGWLNESNSNVNLFASIDEFTISDTDYIKSGVNPVNDQCEINLSNPSSTPAEPFEVWYRYKKSGTSQIDLVVDLVQATTIIKTWTHTNISSSYVTAQQTLSSGEFATITDFNNLRLRFKANKV